MILTRKLANASNAFVQLRTEENPCFIAEQLRSQDHAIWRFYRPSFGG